jgi:hypothetical protein
LNGTLPLHSALRFVSCVHQTIHPLEFTPDFTLHKNLTCCGPGRYHGTHFCKSTVTEGEWSARISSPCGHRTALRTESRGAGLCRCGDGQSGCVSCLCGATQTPEMPSVTYEWHRFHPIDPPAPPSSECRLPAQKLRFFAAPSLTCPFTCSGARRSRSLASVMHQESARPSGHV